MSSPVHETTTVPTPDGTMGVHISRPAGEGPFPVLLFFHRGPGFDVGSWWAMDQFANAGYLVVANDRYYRIEEWPWIDTAALRAAGPGSELQKRFHHLLDATTEDLIALDVEALVSALAANPLATGGAMTAVGYCIGARSVIRSMADRPETFPAGAALQPSQCVTDAPDSPHRLVADVAGSLYVAIGGDDAHAGPEASAPLIDAVRALGDRGVVDIFPGAVHGFTLPGAGYDADIARQVYERALPVLAAAY